MAITFTVEDGTGVTGATTYLSLADAEQIVEDYGLAWASGATDDEKKVALNNGSLFIDTRYPPWKGYKRLSTQGLDWPRSGVVDEDGYVVPNTSVPEDIKRATVEAAVYYNNNDSLFPDADGDGALKAEKIKIDVIEISNEYLGSDAGSEVSKKLSGLLDKYREIGSGMNTEVMRG